MTRVEQEQSVFVRGTSPVDRWVNVLPQPGSFRSTNTWPVTNNVCSKPCYVLQEPQGGGQGRPRVRARAGGRDRLRPPPLREGGAREETEGQGVMMAMLLV